MEIVRTEKHTEEIRAHLSLNCSPVIFTFVFSRRYIKWKITKSNSTELMFYNCPSCIRVYCHSISYMYARPSMVPCSFYLIFIIFRVFSTNLFSIWIIQIFGHVYICHVHIGILYQKQTSKEAHKQASKHTSKQASTQAKKQPQIGVPIEAGSFYNTDVLKLSMAIVLILNTGMYTITIYANFIFTNVTVL